jgi:hypothetical protein
MRLQTGFGLVNRFNDPIKVVTTRTINYNIVADFHTKPSQSTCTSLCVVTALHNGLLCSVFTGRYPLTNLSNGDSFASVARWLTLHSLTLNCLLAPIVFKVTPPHGPYRKQSLLLRFVCRAVA